MTHIEGTCDPRFGAVRDVFAEQFAKPEETQVFDWDVAAELPRKLDVRRS